MGRYVARRLVQAVPLLLAISVAAFAIIKAQPGGPLAQYEGNPDFTEADRVRLEHAFGLDQPLPLQYMTWLASFVRLVAIPIGVATAVRQYSWFDHLVTGATFTFLSTPTFWLGLLLIIAFGLQLRLLPIGGIDTPGQPFNIFDRLRHLVLPVATIALVQLGSHVRYLRASMLETINQDYMRTARSKGLGERAVVLRHALKNAAIPLVTVVALDLPELFVGALVTEQIFGWPGMGRLFWDAATRSDYPVLQGILAVSSTLIVLGNLLADVMYGYLDPRIRFG